MTKRRRVWGWTHKWLNLLGRGETGHQSVTLDLCNPVVAINGYDTERDVCAARAFITDENVTDDYSPLYYDIAWRVLPDLKGIADTPYVVDGFALYYAVTHREYLDLYAVSPEEKVSSLPETVAKLSFLALAALSEYNRRLQTPLKPRRLHLTALKLRHDVVDDEKIIALRDNFRHEPRPLSQKMLESPDALLQAMRESYSFPCYRWWDK